MACSGRALGRPRQTDIEPRSYVAVVDLSSQHGWAGLSLDAVATRAGMGKSTIYLRWKSKRDLLLEAVRYFEINSMVLGSPRRSRPHCPRNGRETPKVTSGRALGRF